MVALLFPGQGSQSAGMGKALADAFPAARQVFEEADQALGMSLSTLCFEGPEEELMKTEFTQPAILATSIAALRALESERPDLKPACVAGHSLGEFSALVAVGALAFCDAVRIVRERGRLMQIAVPFGEGAMAAVLGVGSEVVEREVRRIARETGRVVAAANFNSTEQTVIAGETSAVAGAKEALRAAGASKIVDLPVSAPFHSPLMAPAARGLADVLAPIAVSALSAPLYSNVEAKPNRDAGRVKALLVEQVTAPVRWVEIVRGMIADGVTEAIEVGPGKVLMGLARRIDRSLKVYNVEDPATLAKTIAALSA